MFKPMKNFTSKGLLGALLVSSVVLSANAATGDPYTWPAYNPTCNFNYKALGITYDMPTKNYEGSCYNQRAGEQHQDWWDFVWGSNRNSVVSDVSITNLLQHFNDEFNYITDTMGWPRDKRVQDGYRSTVFLYGSMDCTGSNDNTETGGWQTYIDGYPAVNASYYPVYSFDPSCPYSDRESQMSAMIHEGVHCILTTLGCSHCHWFQESGNTWLQQEMAVRRGGAYSGMGFLNATSLICPFMPVECYSGWLLDGSFGGPGAQGVAANPTCNWRTTLGGSQYSNIFPTFLGLWLSKGAVPWIWYNTTDASKYILETMAGQMGDTQMRRLIAEYRARLCMLDMKGWSEECRNLIDQNFGSSLSCECSSWSGWSCSQSADAWYCTPYTKTTNNNGVLTPESRTTPGWSGANFVPLKYDGSGKAQVYFEMLGTHMSCQLCYRGTDGVPVYSEPLFNTSGDVVLNVNTTPQDNMIFAVVCNTDYAYEGETTRTTHHDYRLTLKSGLTGAGSETTKYHDKWTLTYDWPTLEDDSTSYKPKTIKVVDTKIYNVDLPVGTDYKSTNIVIDGTAIANELGVSLADLKSNLGNTIKFYGVNATTGKNYTSGSTAEDPGYWYSKSGDVCSWNESDENCAIFDQLNLTDMSMQIGQMSGHVNKGETYQNTVAFVYDTIQVNVQFNITMTDPTTAAVKSPYSYEGYTQKQLTTWYEDKVVVADYTIPYDGPAKLALYTPYGALITYITNEQKQAGTYREELDFKSMQLPSGIYLLKLSYPGYSETKMIIAKK